MPLTGPILRRGSERALDEIELPPPSRGIFRGILDVLDTPGRLVRTALAGRNPLPALLDPDKGATSYDLLRRLGVRGRPGFDPTDLAAFAMDVGLDPLTFVAGPGTSQLGRSAKALQSADRTLQVARSLRGTSQLVGPASSLGVDVLRPSQVKFLESIADQASDSIRKLGPRVRGKVLDRQGRISKAAIPYVPDSLAGRADRGMASALRFTVPFTKVDVPLIKGKRFLSAIDKTRERIGESAPGQWLLDKFGNTSRYAKDSITGKVSRRELPELYEVMKGVERAGRREIDEELLQAFRSAPGIDDPKAGRAAVRKYGRERFAILSEQIGRPQRLRELLDAAEEEIGSRTAAGFDVLNERSRKASSRIESIASGVEDTADRAAARKMRFAADAVERATLGYGRTGDEMTRSGLRVDLEEFPLFEDSAEFRRLSREDPVLRETFSQLDREVAAELRGAGVHSWREARGLVRGMLEESGEEYRKKASLFGSLSPKTQRAALLMGEAWDNLLLEFKRSPWDSTPELRDRLRSAFGRDVQEHIPWGEKLSRSLERYGWTDVEAKALRADAARVGEEIRSGTRVRGLRGVDARATGRLPETGSFRLLERIQRELTPQHIRGELRGFENVDLQETADQLRRELVQSTALVDAAPADVMQIARNLHGIREKTLGLEQAAGIGTARLDDTRSYLERVLSPEGSDLLKKMGRLGGFKKAFGHAIRRKKELRDGIDKAMEKLGERYGVREFFELDPEESLRIRGQRSERAIRTAVAVSTAPHMGIMQARKGRQADLGAIMDAAKVPLPRQVREAIEGTTVPDTLASEIVDVLGLSRDRKAYGPIQRVWNDVNGVFRAALTQYFPAFHARNAYSGVFMNFLAGVRSPKYYLQAIRDMKDPEKVAGYTDLGIAGRGYHAFELEEGGSLADKVLPFRKQTAAVHSWVEDRLRVAHYLAKRDAGLDPVSAADSVRRFLFNYDEITDFERRNMRGVFMFYTWSRNALPFIAEQTLKNPRSISVPLRAVTRPGEDISKVPDYLRETAAIPFGTNAQGEQNYLTGLGLPLEELASLDTSSADPGFFPAAQRLLQKLVLKTVPGIRVPTEIAAGQDFFLNRPIQEADRAYAAMRFLPQAMKDAMGFREYQTGAGATQYRADPVLMYLIRNSPASRVINTASQITDPRRRLKDVLVSNITGGRVVSVDQEKEAARALIESIRSALLTKVTQGRARPYTEFVSTGAPGAKDPETVKLIKALERAKAVVKDLR